MTTVDLAQGAFLLGAISRLAMAAILAQSAWHALRDVPAHAAAVAGYRLLPAWLTAPAAWGLPVLSLVSAMLLLVPGASTAGAALGAAVMVVFTTAIFVNLRRGRLHIDCGCGGASGQAISAGLVLRNVLLIAVLAVSGLAPCAGNWNAAALVCVIGGAAGFAALYFTAGQLLANRAAFRVAGFGA